MAKRGESGLCRLVAIDKPVGISSHDVVNRVRRITGERRVGHMGTLDPLASGVLIVSIGPATRLNAYITAQAKRYRMGITFGASTDTDDIEGTIVKTCPITENLFNEDFARETVANLVGSGMQVPPVFSAIKVNGQKAYDAARKGNVITLEPRPFEVFSSNFLSIDQDKREDGSVYPIWNVDMRVSKGTYMRSIARDLGHHLGNAAHVCSLHRSESGAVSLEDCLTLEEFEQFPDEAVVDPVRTLGLRFAFMREGSELLTNGNAVSEDLVHLNEPIQNDIFSPCSCTTSVFPSRDPVNDGEVVALLADNKLKALYEYDQSQHRYKPRCVFPIGVERGSNL